MNHTSRSALAALALFGVLSSAPLSGCSVYMAAYQPSRKDLSVLKTGTPRAFVLAELGQPLATTETNGRKSDIFVFKQGYSPGAKASRAVWHFTADLFTAGLWEVVGTPTEAVFDGTEVKVEVVYDELVNVAQVRAFAGAEELREEVPTVEPATPGATTASYPSASAAQLASSEPARPHVVSSPSTQSIGSTVGAPRAAASAAQKSDEASAADALRYRDKLRGQR